MTPDNLTATDITFRYGKERTIVNNVSMQISRGERVAILGESGSGKSTMVNILAGLYEPLSGTVTMGGRPIMSIPHEHRDFALVPQRPHAIPGLSGLTLLNRPASRSENPSDKIRTALKKLNISNSLASKRLNKMSGGELQLMYLTRVMVWSPRFIFLDEPFNSIDVAIKSSLYPTLLNHQSSIGCGLVLITHDSREALLMCTRLVIMRDGFKVADGRVDELVKAPPDSKTAMLIRGASTNLLRVHLTFETEAVIIVESVLGRIRGIFTSHPGSESIGEFALGLFPWDEILGTDAVSDRTFDVTGVQNGDSAPTLLTHGVNTVYARLRSVSPKVSIECITRTLLLYDEKSFLLLGNVQVCNEGKL